MGSSQTHDYGERLATLESVTKTHGKVIEAIKAQTDRLVEEVRQVRNALWLMAAFMGANIPWLGKIFIFIAKLAGVTGGE